MHGNSPIVTRHQELVKYHLYMKTSATFSQLDSKKFMEKSRAIIERCQENLNKSKDLMEKMGPVVIPTLKDTKAAVFAK